MLNLFLLPFILLFASIQGQDLKPVDPIPVDPVEPAIFCGYSDQALCSKDQSCWWDPTLFCSNKLNCSSVPLEKCEGTKFCHLVKPIPGYCYGPPPHCSSYSNAQCLKDPLCYWLSSYQCIAKNPQPPFPNCASFNPIQCQKNAEYCNLNGQCTNNTKFCSALTYSQCLQDPHCKYIWTQKEQCLNNPNYCKGLNEQECLKNKFCLGQYTAPSCKNSYNCNGLTYEQCIKNKVCSAVTTPPSCTPKKNICSQQTNTAACIAAGCQASVTPNGVFVCQYPYACSQFDEEKCKANPQICDFNPGTYYCKNTFDCTQITSPKQCSLNSLCTYIPSVFQCVPNNTTCPLLQGVDCKNNPACIYVPAQGQCTQISSFACNQLSLVDCYSNKQCLLKYTCTPKKLPNCNLLSLADCKKSTYCQLIDKGKCYDKKYDCNLPYNKCIYTIPCVWNPGKKGSCANDLECGGLSEDACKQNDVYCNLTVGGCKPRFK